MNLIFRYLVKTSGYIIPSFIGNWFSRLFSGKLINQLKDKATDSLIELLLNGMDLCFCLSRSFRKNLTGYKGNILIETKDGAVKAGARFSNSKMTVIQESIDDWDVRIQVKNPETLRKFIFSKNNDIINAILENNVNVDGNLNHVYKFSFMIRDLANRFKIL